MLIIILIFRHDTSCLSGIPNLKTNAFILDTAWQKISDSVLNLKMSLKKINVAQQKCLSRITAPFISCYRRDKLMNIDLLITLLSDLALLRF